MRGVRPARWKASRPRAEAGRATSTKAAEPAGPLSAKGVSHLTAPRQRAESSTAGSPQARLRDEGGRGLGEEERGGEQEGPVVKWVGEGVAWVGVAREGGSEQGGGADSEKASSRSRRVTSSGGATARWRAAVGRRRGSLRRGLRRLAVKRTRRPEAAVRWTRLALRSGGSRGCERRWR